MPMSQVKDHTAPSVFRPEHLLREARRQRRLPERDVPAVCVLDPDGDLVRYLRRTGKGRLSPGWACYHTELLEFDLPDGSRAGVVGCAVGAPFAVLVAEQLFASGCRFLVSITIHCGATWTTDAPYRETEAAIAAARALGVLAVEMEAAALYAFATARQVPVVCFAHVTNTMGQHGGDDFEKGEADGTLTAMRLIGAAARAFRATMTSKPA